MKCIQFLNFETIISNFSLIYLSFPAHLMNPYMLTPSLSSRSVPFHPKKSSQSSASHGHRPLISSPSSGRGEMSPFFVGLCLLLFLGHQICKLVAFSFKLSAGRPLNFTSISSSDDQKWIFVFIVHWLVIGRRAQHPISFQKTPLFFCLNGFSSMTFILNYFKWFLHSSHLLKQKFSSWNFIFFKKKNQWSTN